MATGGEQDADTPRVNIIGWTVLNIPPAIEEIPYDVDVHLSYEEQKKRTAQSKFETGEPGSHFKEPVST